MNHARLTKHVIVPEEGDVQGVNVGTTATTLQASELIKNRRINTPMYAGITKGASKVDSRALHQHYFLAVANCSATKQLLLDKLL